jgi:hypothetical protein
MRRVPKRLKGKPMAVETQEYRAEARFQRVSPQKARLVLNLVKGLGVQKALETLQFTKKRIAPVVHKVLTSALDNAKYLSDERGLDLDVDNLIVKTGDSQRRAAHEAHPSCSDGPGVPLPAPVDAHHRFGGRAVEVAEQPRLMTKPAGHQGGSQDGDQAVGNQEGGSVDRQQVSQVGRVTS